MTFNPRKPYDGPSALEHQKPSKHSALSSVDDLRLVFPDVKWDPDGDDVVDGAVEASDGLGHLHTHRFQLVWMTVMSAPDPVAAIRTEIEIAKLALERKMPVDGVGMRRRGAVSGRLQPLTNPCGESGFTAVHGGPKVVAAHPAGVHKADRFASDDVDFAARLRADQVEAARRRLNGD